MELVIGLVVLAVAGYFIFFRNKEEQAPAKTEEVPYKVETPVTTFDVTPPPVAVVEGAGAVEIPPAPVVEEAPAKKTRKPRAPKAEAKPAAKKAAVKKPAAIKATKKSKKA